MMEANIFSQMLTALKIVNDNVVAVNENMNDMRQKIDAVEAMIKHTEPNAIGAELANTIDGSNENI